MRSAVGPIRWPMIVGTLLGGVALCATGHQPLAAPPSFTETLLYRADLSGINERELIVSRLETSAGWSHGRHYHAGHEVVYVLEGEGALEVEGIPAQRLQPGTVAHVPPGRIHAGRNTSRTAAFKFLLIRIHVKGEPMSVELN
jgi:quercetin dioxygenase-like cupin family protein